MIIGIDEVGRGCWAGPLVAAAVKLDHDFVHAKDSPWKLGDSKKLSKKQRGVSFSEIKNMTGDIGLGWVWPLEINQFGLTESVRLAMQRAIEAIILEEKDEIIIDGNINYLKTHLEHISSISKARPWKCRAVVGADGMIPAVSAASIIAKVARDEYMTKIANKYPAYGFDKHVGYGTRLHIEALELHGVTPIHRLNYKPIQMLLDKSK